MSDLNINNITDRTGDSGPVIAGVSTVSSTGAFTVPVGPTEYRGGRGRAIFAGGYTEPSPGERDTMDKIEIATAGNSIDFGNLTVARYNPGGGVASSTRGLFSGGRKETSPASNLTVIDYVVISSGGGANDWGDLPNARQTHAGASNNIRGLYAGGRGIYPGQTENSALGIPTIEYVTIATTGRSEFFGDLLTQRMAVGGLNSSTRVLFCGGYSTPAKSNAIEYVEIATTGNAIDFGDLTVGKYGQMGMSNSTRGYFAAGVTYPGATRNNIIDFVTFTTTGNAIDSGDLAIAHVNSVGTMSDSHGGVE